MAFCQNLSRLLPSGPAILRFFLSLPPPPFFMFVFFFYMNKFTVLQKVEWSPIPVYVLQVIFSETVAQSFTLQYFEDRSAFAEAGVKPSKTLI